MARQLADLAEERGGDGTRRRAAAYAVIVDEAHSSQSGETATDLKEVLGGEALHERGAAPAEEDEAVELEDVTADGQARAAGQSQLLRLHRHAEA